MHRKLSPCSVLRKLLLRCFFLFFFATKSLCDVRAVIIRWMHSERFSCAQAASSSKPQRAGRVSENTEQKDTSAGELWTSSGLSASSRVQLSLQLVTACEQRQHHLNCQPNTKNQFVCSSFVSCSWAAGQATWWTSSWGITSALWGQQALQARSVWL